jgi:hypothetical protein
LNDSIKGAANGQHPSAAGDRRAPDARLIFSGRYGHPHLADRLRPSCSHCRSSAAPASPVFSLPLRRDISKGVSGAAAEYCKIDKLAAGNVAARR